MTKYQEKEENKRPDVTSADIEKLRRDLKPFTQKKINGKLVSSFDQYLCSLGVMKYGNEGVVVYDAVGYTRMNQINSRLELREYHEDQEFFNQNPVARDAHVEKIAAMRANLADKFKV